MKHRAIGGNREQSQADTTSVDGKRAAFPLSPADPGTVDSHTWNGNGKPYSPEPPAAARPSSSSRPTRLERAMLRSLVDAFRLLSVRVLLWDGTDVTPQTGVARWTIQIGDRRTLWKLLLSPEYQFMECYSRGTLTVDGDLTELLSLPIDTLNTQRPWLHRWETWLARFRSRRSLTASRENIARHYDLGNDFYRLWLDDQLVYTCAYYESDSVTLEAAQCAKMDHVCRKLRLQPGEQVIEAGCGWGGLALHMARHYGAQVRAYNISKEQLAYARERARAEELDSRVEFIEGDWREITGRCDAFVSVGMLEHVGPENYGRLGKLIRNSLNPDGRGLIHSIGKNLPEPMNRWVERRIFPGADPPTLKQMMDIFEPAELSVLDVENLRLHYARTLEHWLHRFEQTVEPIQKMFDDTFVRLWRMYLCASRAAFLTGGLQLYQVLFAPEECNAIPATRAYMYGE